jgi:hypothetical protein
MNTLVVVMGWGGSQEIFERHLPLFEHHNCPILIWTPINAPYDTVHEQFSIAPSAHAYEHAYERCRSMILELARRKCDRYLVLEYDSFSLEPVIPDCNEFRGNLQDNREFRFRAPRYPTPPWLIQGEQMQRMAWLLRRMQNVLAFGYMDRMWGELARLANIPLFNHNPVGFTRSTVEIRHAPDMIKWAEGGGTMIHGVKDPLILGLLLEARARFLKAESDKPPPHPPVKKKKLRVSFR